MLKPVANGALVSVAIVVHVFAPIGLRWKATCAVSAEEVALSVTEPRRFAPGSSSATIGARLSIVIVRVADVTTLPARSVATTSRSAGPSGAVDVSQSTEYGAVESVPTVVNDEEPLALTRNCTEATPAVASAAFAFIVTLPETVAPSAGAVSAAVGFVLSTTFPVSVETDWLVAPSRKTARRSYDPSETAVVSQAAVHGALESVAIVVHELAPAGEYSKATELIPAPPSEGVAVSDTLPRRY